MSYLLTSLREHPELAIFLTLAIGFVIGRIKIGSFKFGNVLGTLIAGVLIGQLDIKVDATVKSVFFSLFLFATGYKVGPQFFRGLKKNALRQVALTVVLCVTSLVTTLAAAKLLNYDTGTAAGLMAGAFTESTVIGTASDTIDRLDLPEAEKTRLKNNIPVAYAVSYLVGTGFVVWFLSAMAPLLLRVDMKAEAKKLAASGGGRARRPRSSPGLQGMEHSRLPAGRQRGRQDRRRFRAGRETRARLRRAHPPRDRTARGPADGGAAVGRCAGHRGAAQSAAQRHPAASRGARGPQAARLPDGDARRRGHEAEAAEQTLSVLAERHGRGVILNKLIRGGEEIPFDAETIINRGDLLRLSGVRARRGARRPRAGLHRASLE